MATMENTNKYKSLVFLGKSSYNLSYNMATEFIQFHTKLEYKTDLRLLLFFLITCAGFKVQIKLLWKLLNINY